MANKLFRKNESGQVLVILVFVAMVIFLFGAVMINLGQVSSTRIRLQNAVDATALAIATYQARGRNAIADLNEDFLLEKAGCWNPGNSRKGDRITGFGRIYNLGNFISAGASSPAKSTQGGAREAVDDYIANLRLIQDLQELQITFHQGIIDRIGPLYLMNNTQLPLKSVEIKSSQLKEGLNRQHRNMFYTWWTGSIIKTPGDSGYHHWHRYKEARWDGEEWHYTYPGPDEDSTWLPTEHKHIGEKVYSCPICGYKNTKKRITCKKCGTLLIKSKKYEHWMPHTYNLIETDPGVPVWYERTKEPLKAQVGVSVASQEVILGGRILGIRVPEITAVAQAETYGGPRDGGQMWNEYEHRDMLPHYNEGRPRAQFKARLVRVAGTLH